MIGAEIRLGLALAAVAAAAVGCGTEEAEKAPTAPSASKPTASEPPAQVDDPPSTEPSSARFEERTTFTDAAEGEEIIRGAFDLSRMRGRAVASWASRTETIQVGSRCFRGVDDGPWSEEAAQDPQGLCSSALFGHPRDDLELIRSISGELTTIGRGSVRGVETVRYSTELAIGAVQGSMEYWVAADGVPRRIVQRDADGGYVTTTEYFGFGEPVEVEPPSAGS